MISDFYNGWEGHIETGFALRKAKHFSPSTRKTYFNFIFRKEVLCRIADAQVTPDPPLVSPPSYEEAMACPRSHTDGASSQSLMTYHDLGLALQELKVETGAETVHLIYIQENVRIYFISPDGTVSTPSEPKTLQIAQLEGMLLIF
jgi:hypothetical protein